MQVGALGSNTLLGTPGKNDAGGVALPQLGGRRVIPDNFGIDMLFPHAPGDELRILRPEIQYGDPVVVLHGVIRPYVPMRAMPATQFDVSFQEV